MTSESCTAKFERAQSTHLVSVCVHAVFVGVDGDSLHGQLMGSPEDTDSNFASISVIVNGIRLIALERLPAGLCLRYEKLEEAPKSTFRHIRDFAKARLPYLLQRTAMASSCPPDACDSSHAMRGVGTTAWSGWGARAVMHGRQRESVNIVSLYCA